MINRREFLKTVVSGAAMALPLPILEYLKPPEAYYGIIHPEAYRALLHSGNLSEPYGAVVIYPGEYGMIDGIRLNQQMRDKL